MHYYVAQGRITPSCPVVDMLSKSAGLLVEGLGPGVCHTCANTCDPPFPLDMAFTLDSPQPRRNMRRHVSLSVMGQEFRA